MPLDSQQIEVLGRNLLISALLREGIEVAMPIRDNGIDLMVYAGFDTAWKNPYAVPVQLKCASTTAWGINSKYERIRHLRIVHVWHVSDGNAAEFHCLTYQDAMRVLDMRGYSSSEAWRNHGTYAVNAVGAELRTTLAPFSVAAGQWGARLFGRS